MELTPVTLNLHAIVCLILTVLALFAFSSEKIRIETASLGLMVVLSVFFSLVPLHNQSGHFEPSSLFYGFGHEALIAVCALLVVGQGLVRTGALEPVGNLLALAWQRSAFLSFLATLVLGAVLSAFVNNTPIVVLLLPILVSVSLRTRSSPSAVLMPMGFATLIGGMGTTIGTSTNLLVVSVAADMGVPKIGMFDFAMPALIAAGVAIAYLWLIAPRLLPERQAPIRDISPRLFEARIHLPAESPAVGKTLAEAIARTDGSMQVTRIGRGENFLMPLPDAVLQEGDRLRITNTPSALKAMEEQLGGTLYSNQSRVDDEHPLSAPDQQVAEIAVVQGMALDGRSLRNTRFMTRYNLVALAIHRQGAVWRPREQLADVVMRAGDVLLVQGARDDLSRLRQTNEFLVLDASVELKRSEKAPIALLTLLGIIVTAATGILPIAVAAMAGAAVMMMTRCIGWGAAIRAISPSVFFVVAASLALGRALIESGATDYLTWLFLSLSTGAPISWMLAGLMLFMAVLTNVVSNNAAAVIGTPIAIGIAQQLGVDPMPFILAVLFGANMSFATPMAYKTNLLVMSAGNYTFGDFLRAGIPLTIIMWITLSAVLAFNYQ